MKTIKNNKDKDNNNILNPNLNYHEVLFICASCNNKYKIKSTLKEKETTIEICSSCHPFYIGTNVGQQIRGRAEKFNKKLETSKQTKKTASKHSKNPKAKKNKAVTSLKDIKDL